MLSAAIAVAIVTSIKIIVVVLQYCSHFLKIESLIGCLKSQWCVLWSKTLVEGVWSGGVVSGCGTGSLCLSVCLSGYKWFYIDVIHEHVSFPLCILQARDISLHPLSPQIQKKKRTKIEIKEHNKAKLNSKQSSYTSEGEIMPTKKLINLTKLKIKTKQKSKNVIVLQNNTKGTVIGCNTFCLTHAQQILTES